MVQMNLIITAAGGRFIDQTLFLLQMILIFSSLARFKAALKWIDLSEFLTYCID